MALAVTEVTYTGRELVAKESDRTITFTGLLVDWATAGLAAWMELIYPDGETVTRTQLAAVSGDVYAAKLTNTNGIFPVAGQYKAKIYGTDGVKEKNLASINYNLKVYP